MVEKFNFIIEDRGVCFDKIKEDMFVSENHANLIEHDIVFIEQRNRSFVVFEKNEHLVLCTPKEFLDPENQHISFVNKTKKEFIFSLTEDLNLIVKDGQNTVFELHDFLNTNGGSSLENSFSLHNDFLKTNFEIFDFVFGNKVFRFSYDFSSEKVSYRCFKFSIHNILSDKLSIRLKSNNIIGIKFDGKPESFFTLNEVLHSSKKEVCSLKKPSKSRIVGIFSINGKKISLVIKKNRLFLTNLSLNRLTGFNSKVKSFKFGSKFYLYGRMTHYHLNSHRKFDHAYIGENDERLNIIHFKRPFAFVPLMRRYVFGSFKPQKIELKKIHNAIKLGDKDIDLQNLSSRANSKFKYIKKNNHIFILRRNVRKNFYLTSFPFSKEYSRISRFKIKFNYEKNRLFTNRNQKINLFFEKKSNKADESGYKVFSRVDERRNEFDSKNYFILDGNHPDFKKLKEKHGDRLVKKFTSKHFDLIFKATGFIASELSNHVLNDRLFLPYLNEKIKKTPLVFLQHGIMFAKPIDNPMAKGFWKKHLTFNLKKTVVSSELEAGEFYRMGYNKDDLIFSGLAKFDDSYLDSDADKIAYMPTYRYWEEPMIYSNDIESTTYYKSIMNFIRYFEAKGRLKDLLIVPHNKFSEYIYNNMPEYQDIIVENPSDALRKSKIFITDYSSAIYDSIFRGAYPIFYWEEQDYLIENYKATPSLNASNAPGDLAYNLDDIYNSILYAESHDYKMKPDAREKFERINAFNDRKNTDRIIDDLVENNYL